MKKGKSLIIVTIFAWLFTIVFSPVLLLGYIIYLLSKLMRSLGFIMMLKRYSVSDELAGFWRVYESIRDYKVKL
jgi:hypothetical protein